MREDMAMRGLRSDTQHDYVRVVRSFAAFLGQQLDTTTAEDMTADNGAWLDAGTTPFRGEKGSNVIQAAGWNGGPARQLASMPLLWHPLQSSVD